MFHISLINNPSGGIIILPVNFICSIRKSDVDLEKKFLSVYDIQKINIFEEQVFNDTGYSVCSLYFLKKNYEYNVDIKIYIYPSKEMCIKLNEENDYTIGRNFSLPQNSMYKIQRATKNNYINITNILQMY